MTAGLSLAGVSLAVGGRPLIERLDLHVPRGAVAAVTGPSGAGKSSLLAFLCGTLDPAFAVAGTVAVDGVRIDTLPPQRRRLGILFQDDLLFPHLSVGENIAFGLPATLRGRAARRAAVAAALEEVELPGLADRDPATLSGGQRARVALMRMLVAEPRALLLDEPFAALDRPLRARLRALVFARARARRLPVLLVTHDPQDASAADGPLVRLG